LATERGVHQEHKAHQAQGGAVPDPTARDDDPGDWEARLVALATDSLAGAALAGMRGPMSRGAVPVQTLAHRLNVSRGKIARDLDRLAGVTRATPLDLVARHVFDPEHSGERALRQAFVSLLPGTAGQATFDDATLGAVREALSELLTAAFDDPVNRRVSGLAQLLHMAALLCDPASSGDATARAAESILELRAASYRESLAVQSAGLRLLLSAAGRRPLPGFDEERIVCALQCLFDGYLARFTMDAVAWPMSELVEVAWELAMSLTEPADDAQGDGSDPSTSPAGAATTDTTSTLGDVPDLRRLVRGVPGAWRLAVELLLTSASVSRGAGSGDPPRDQIVTAVAELIGAPGALAGDVDPLRAATLLVDNAIVGPGGKPAWEALLTYLEGPTDPDRPVGRAPGGPVPDSC